MTGVENGDLVPSASFDLSIMGFDWVPGLEQTGNLGIVPKLRFWPLAKTSTAAFDSFILLLLSETCDLGIVEGWGVISFVFS